MSDAIPGETVSGRNETTCFHCGQPLPDGVRLVAVIANSPRSMCCVGCKAAAETIVSCGLERFYQVRSADAPKPEPGAAVDERFAAFDDPTLQQRFVVSFPDAHVEAALLLDGLACTACCWLIEQRLSALTGLDSITVNYARRSARVKWDPRRLAFSAILAAVAQLGYHASPYDAASAERQLAQERSVQLRRIGIAGLFGMQIMTLSLGLYLGADAGVDPGLADLFRGSAAVLVLPVLLYSAQPFFRGAIRDLRARSLGMDVPVALGIAIAFLGSLHSLATGRGHVYFDSIAMFVFILLCGRFVEFTVRRRTAAGWDRLQRIQPAVATRLRPGVGATVREEIVPVTALKVGETVLVRPGETIPVDGVIIEGISSIDEALLTGESRPVARGIGDSVLGGSINMESPLKIEVRRISSDSRLAQIAHLAQQAESGKPALQPLSSRIAGRFIARLLLIAAGVALFWWFRDPERWVPITVSVLVITCPCALALAAPVAVAAATGTWLRLGLLARSASAVETLARASRFVFDKTGTLTTGRLQVTGVKTKVGIDPGSALAIAAELEGGSEHAIGKAIRSAHEGSVPAAEQVRNFPGEGVSGRVRGMEYFLGSSRFITRMTIPSAAVDVPTCEASQAATSIILATREEWLAVFSLGDSLRTGAQELIDELSSQGSEVGLLSGDGRSAVEAVATGLGIRDAHAELLPAQKLEQLGRWRSHGGTVCMIGDGINDAPVLAAAHVSVAMGAGADLARANADIILLDDRLEALRAGIGVARNALRVMRQNMAWAIGYNLLAVPLAAAGLVTPWMAALGMSLSSLLVVLNAARLTRLPAPAR